jgi:hypothetical protein
MEKALETALQGIAPPPMTASTTAMASEDATQMLSGDRTQAMPPQRRLQPIDAPRRRPAPAPAAAPARRREPARWGRRLFALIFLAGAIAAGVYGYMELESIRNQPDIQEVRGDFDESIGTLRDLIQNNTR